MSRRDAPALTEAVLGVTASLRLAGKLPRRDSNPRPGG